MNILDGLPAKLQKFWRIHGARSADLLLQAGLSCLPRNQRAIGIVRDQNKAIRIGVAGAHERGTEIALVGDISFADDHFGAKLLGGVRKMIATRASPIGVEMQNGELLQAKMA